MAQGYLGDGTDFIPATYFSNLTPAVWECFAPTYKRRAALDRLKIEVRHK